MPQPVSMAYFISSHGFGHAARACAVIEAVYQILPAVNFEIFTQVPRWFFEESLNGSFNYHDVPTDVGVVQKDSLTEDLPSTVRQLAQMKTFYANHKQNLAEQIIGLGCQLVLCDIAPLGLVVAQAAGVPGVLVENFTWDWIYQGYEPLEPGLWPFIDDLQTIFSSASYHVQTEPICLPGHAHLTTTPVSRKPRTPPTDVRKRLNIPTGEKMVLMTMGGVNWEYTFLERLEDMQRVHFVVPAAGLPEGRRGNVTLLSPQSEFYHPDLVSACDVIIGKVGYSTLAEAYHAGIPFGYVARAKFRESEPLMAFIDAQMNGLRISESQFLGGNWVSALPNLLATPRVERNVPNGAEQIAEFVLALLN